MSTEPDGLIVFGPYRIDGENQQLWREEQLVALQPKPLAVLQYLAERPGQVVSKQELLTSVWDTIVSPAVVKECVRAIRDALAEDALTPQYIETVGREGYRFLGSVTAGAVPVSSSKLQVPSSDTQHSGLSPQRSLLVGREAELSQLHRWLDKALNGQPQLVFVTGEPGIGKTTLVDQFRAQLRTNGNLTIGRGQCIAQYGGGEAYLPMLEALSRLCREEGGQHIIALLRTYAPTWLVQLSGVLEDTEAQQLRLQVQGATQQRMLREMEEAIEAGTARRPLVLILEDLHWSDQATVELLSYLAQRRERAHILIVATYRPADLVTRNHPLKAIKQELHAKGQCEELRVELLSEPEVNEYLSRRFPQHQFPPALTAEIHRRTEGNALFMVNVVEELLQQGCIVEEGERWLFQGDLTQLATPDTLRQLIEKQVQQRSEEERRILEVASIAGTEFAVAAVAAALKQDLDAVEEICEDLAWQGHFLEERGLAEWPDGTMSGRYAFRHALYQNVLYEQIAEVRRVRLHRLIGERLEAGYGEQAKEIAAELAVHFEQGRDYRQAVQYCQFAGENAATKNAFHEAVDHLTKGLALLKTLPDTPERTQQELFLQTTLGQALAATKGFSASEVEQAYARALELCHRVEETPQLFLVLWGLHFFYHGRREFQTTGLKLAEQMVSLAQNLQNPRLLRTAYGTLGFNVYWGGKFASAQTLLEEGLSPHDPYQPLSVHTRYYREILLLYSSLTLWHLGYPDQAFKRCREALALVEELSHHPERLAWTLENAAWFYLLRREWPLARELAEAAITLSTEQGFPYWTAWGTIERGWALAEQEQVEEGIAQMCQGLATFQAIGAELPRIRLLPWLAAAYARAREAEKGLSALAEALEMVDKTEERLNEAELYRLKGELTLQQENQTSKGKRQKSKIKTDSRSPLPIAQAEAENEGLRLQAEGYRGKTEEAEECFLKAIEISQKQQAKSLELRATMSLARLWKQQGKQREAHAKLSHVYNWFTEGFDTKDLQEAKALIKELSH